MDVQMTQHLGFSLKDYPEPLRYIHANDEGECAAGLRVTLNLCKELGCNQSSKI